MGRRRLIKKYRIDEVVLHDIGVKVGIYVNNSSGKFYALIPEQEDGQYLEGDKLPKLRSDAREAAKAFFTLDWRKIIRVDYKSAHSWQFNFNGSSSGRGRKWNPDDWTTASDQVGPMSVMRCEVAERPDGKMVEREWDDGKGGHRRIRWVGPTVGNATTHDLPWDQDTWVALHEFKDKIKLLDHAIRTFLNDDDFLPKLLAMSGALVIPEVTTLAITDTVGEEP